MSRGSPSYITKTKHGIYYFQLRISPSLAKKLNIRSPIYRKSLHTKDKRLALVSARRLWLSIYNFSILGAPLPDYKNNKFDVGFAEALMQEEVERSRQIKIAIKYSPSRQFLVSAKSVGVFKMLSMLMFFSKGSE